MLVGIKRCYICNAKFLSKSFYRFCTMFELFEDKQRAKLGGVDAPKMHLLFQSLCFIICSGIFPYLNKTAEYDAVFSKVSFLAIFAGNKIGEKYHVIFYGKGGQRAKDGHEGAPEAQKRGPHAATVPGRVGPPNWSLGRRLSFGFSRTPSYIQKSGCPKRGRAFAKHTAAATTIFVSGTD